jgi:hypothetical protein
MRHTPTALLALGALALAAIPARAWEAPTWYRYIGSGGSGAGEFQFPSGIATDGSGHFYVCDFDNNRIQILDPSGSYLGQIAPTDRVLGPNYAVVHPNGDLYVTDLYFAGVVRLTTAGAVVSSFGAGLFHNPYGIATDAAGNLVVASRDDGKILRFAPDGTSLGVWSTAVPTPFGIAVSSSGETFVAGDTRVYVLDGSGVLLRTFGEGGLGSPDFGQAVSVRIGPDELVYVCDQAAGVSVFTQAGDFLGAWGQSSSSTDLQDPVDIAFVTPVLFWVSDLTQGHLAEYGPNGVPVVPISWGGIKARYR